MVVGLMVMVSETATCFWSIGIGVAVVIEKLGWQTGSGHRPFDGAVPVVGVAAEHLVTVAERVIDLEISAGAI